MLTKFIFEFSISIPIEDIYLDDLKKKNIFVATINDITIERLVLYLYQGCMVFFNMF